MNEPAVADSADCEAVRVHNREGKSPYLLVCEHASNFIPEPYGTLGLDPAELERHIAWDPGAAPVVREMASLLDAPLVESRISRLVIDCNRPVDAPDLISEFSETTTIPGNVGLDGALREERIAISHRPFHAALDALVTERLANGQAVRIVTMHSFTPVYRGVERPWHVGVIHDDDERLARPLLAGLQAVEGITVGANQPYSPADRVYYTLERHARPRGLACAMIEIRNDEIRGEAGQKRWAGRLAAILSGIQEPELDQGVETASKAKGHRRSA